MGSSRYTPVQIFLNSVHGFGLVSRRSNLWEGRRGSRKEGRRKQSPTNTNFCVIVLYTLPRLIYRQTYWILLTDQAQNDLHITVTFTFISTLLIRCLANHVFKNKLFILCSIRTKSSILLVCWRANIAKERERESREGTQSASVTSSFLVTQHNDTKKLRSRLFPLLPFPLNIGSPSPN